jgi:hypothetical protein
MTIRICLWCCGDIPARARRDALCCSTRCRQARHRFTRAVGQASCSAGAPLRLAYADPPYPGMAARYYSSHPDFAGEVDHRELIRRLSTYDGWALSTSAEALPMVLGLCPAGVRVAAWHRGERPTRSARPQNAWEPVIYSGGRPVVLSGTTRRADPRDASVMASRDASCSTAAQHDASAGSGRDAFQAAHHDTSPRGHRDASPRSPPDASSSAERDAYQPGRRDASRSAAAQHDASRLQGRRLDSLIYHSRPRRTDPQRVIGSKPAVFCRWVFDLLGAQAGDEFADLFPGSGGVTRAWASFVATTNRC